jgi:hypothetical protein
LHLPVGIPAEVFTFGIFPVISAGMKFRGGRIWWDRQTKFSEKSPENFSV